MDEFHFLLVFYIDDNTVWYLDPVYTFH